MKYMKIGCFLFLLLLALLTGCAADTDEVSPTLTIDGMPAINNTSLRNLSGTVEPGATVEVSVNTTATVAALSNVDGLWSATIANLAPGQNTVTVTATDATGNSNTLSLVLIYEVVTLERFVSPTRLPDQTVGGMIAPGGSDPVVAVNTVVVGTGTVVGDFWSFDLSGLIEGVNTVTVTYSDPDALIQVVTAVITVDTKTPAPLVTIDPLSNTTLDPRQAFSGTMDNGVTMLVSLNGAVAVAAEMPTTTTWTFTPPLDPNDLRAGKNSVAVTGTAASLSTTVARTFVVLEPTP
jgi:hypothetical protein